MLHLNSEVVWSNWSTGIIVEDSEEISKYHEKGTYIVYSSIRIAPTWNSTLFFKIGFENAEADFFPIATYISLRYIGKL